MNIDLTGTPFALDYDQMTWEVTGYEAEGEVTRDEGPGRIVDTQGGGWCGDIVPVPEIRLRFFEE